MDVLYQRVTEETWRAYRCLWQHACMQSVLWRVENGETCCVRCSKSVSMALGLLQQTCRAQQRVRRAASMSLYVFCMLSRDAAELSCRRLCLSSYSTGPSKVTSTSIVGTEPEQPKWRVGNLSIASEGTGVLCSGVDAPCWLHTCSAGVQAA